MLWVFLAAWICGQADVKTISPDYSKAPEVRAEDLGHTAVGRTGGLALLAPSTDGKGVSAYMAYYDHAFQRDPWEVCEVNLATKEVAWYNSGKKGDLWNWMLGPDGRLYTYSNKTVWRFDPRAKKFEEFGPTSPDGSNYSAHWSSSSGKLFIGTYPNSRVVQFDPQTGAFHDYGPMGPERKHPAYAYSITGDDEYIYVARGKIPWYLIALNIRTGQQTELATLPQEGMISVTARDGVCYAILNKTAYEAGAANKETYTLKAGQMARVEALPDAKPDPKQPAKGIAAGDGWEICRWSGYGMPDGMAEFWFRRAGEEWQSVKYRCGGTPARIFHITALADGRLAGSTDDPYSIFLFDPKAGKTTVLGQAPCHTYDLLQAGGKLYMSGYANAPLDVYDPARPWTARPQTPQGFAPAVTAPEANPRLATDFNRAPFMQKWSPSLALGADGKIYVACKAEREKTGGCLGWYDPKTGKSDGIAGPFQTQSISQVLAAKEGRTILCSTCFAQDPNNLGAGDKQAHVFAYDVEKGTIVGDVVPVPDTPQWQTSALIEWRPGKVLGRINHPSGKGTVFFVLDVATMKVDDRVLLAGPAAGLPARFADGRLFGIQGESVYQLDPATWTFTPVANLGLQGEGREGLPAGAGAPVRGAVALGDYLYFTVLDKLMRVKVE